MAVVGDNSSGKDGSKLVEEGKMSIDKNNIKQVMLAVINDHSADRGGFQIRQIIDETAEKLEIDEMSPAVEQMILTVWYDLFREGNVSWGRDPAEPMLPFAHVTDRGRAAFEQLSRDPSNPEGYLANLRAVGTINDVALSYIDEALKTYNSSCHKAAAVMVGCASESLVLEVRNALVDRITASGDIPSSKLNQWKIKTVLHQLANEFTQRKSDMPRDLQEEYESHWSTFTGQIRLTRNEVGHPSSIAPVTPERVHASLLIFPELAELSSRLIQWIQKMPRIHKAGDK